MSGHRPMPRADNRIKIRITPARIGFDVSVSQGLMSGTFWWALTRKGAERRGRREAQRMIREAQRRAQTEEIIVEAEERGESWLP